MSAGKIQGFGGMVPAVDSRLLPDTAAAYAQNTRLYTGKLTGLPMPTLIRANTPGTAKVFRIPNGTNLDGAHIADSVWLEFADANTDVLRAPVVGDTFERFYWASASGQPRYNTKARIQAATNSLLLGIPQPAALSVTPSGGVSAIVVTRAYVQTWVSAYGEEGPPSTPFTVTGKQDDTFTATLTAAAANDTNGTNRNLTKSRIYRTVTASTGVTTYFFVAEITIATLSYADTLSDAVVAGQSALVSTNWTAPPTDLLGWVAMPNGMFVGWRANELWFSEPYRPHAWPVAYVLAVDYPVVGLGVTNQTLVICTQSTPMTGSGVHPSVFTTSKIKSPDPCMSRGSILSTTSGVFYASPNGLIRVFQGTAVNYTENMLSKSAWQSIVSFPTLRAAALGGSYFAYGTTLPGVFQSNAFQTNAFAQTDFTGALNGVLIDPDTRVALTQLVSTVPVQCVQSDEWSGELLTIYNDNLYWYDMSTVTPTVQTYKWRSKIFQGEDRKSLGVLRVYFETTSATPGLNPTRNTNLVQTLAADQWGLVRAYADGVLVMCRELRTSGELMRLPSDRKADFWQWEVEARVDVLSIQWATSVRVLKNV